MKALANPAKLKPTNKDALLQVVIETPAGSRNKFALDPDRSVFALKKVLPAGMVFPTILAFSLRRWLQTATRSMFCC